MNILQSGFLKNRYFGDTDPPEIIISKNRWIAKSAYRNNS